MAEGFDISVAGEIAENFSGRANRALDKAVELLALEVWGNVAREAPTDEGRLAGSFEIDRIGSRAWSIFTNVKYAAFVNEGTGIYGPAGRRITPRRASVLVFRWLGTTWFRRSVAGQKANAYADRSVDKASSRAQDFADIAIREVFG